MTPSPEAVKAAQQQAWAAGDFSVVGAGSALVGELLCEAVELHAGEHVLDVATGAGNTALSAARRGARVVGVDFVPAGLERARERAIAERFKHVSFEEGDAEALPFPDASFDVVLSTFGHMFAPDPHRAASEMARVCRPGGRIGFAAWMPDSFAARMFRLTARYSPPPPSLPPPVLWGDENIVRERFAFAADRFRFTVRHHNFRALSPEQWSGFMREHLGPLKTAFQKLDPSAQARFAEELLGLGVSENRSGDATLFIPSAYLETVVYLK